MKKNDIIEHGDIHPFGIPEFEELIYIAQQRRLYEQIEEKFRYGEWGVKLVQNQNKQRYIYLNLKGKINLRAILRHPLGGISV